MERVVVPLPRPLQQRRSPREAVEGPDLLRRLQNVATFRLVQPKRRFRRGCFSSLKYLMAPAFQGALARKQANPGVRLAGGAREHALSCLTQCQSHHVVPFELTKLRTAQLKITLS